jgi:ferredoxin-like protein FixX
VNVPRIKGNHNAMLSGIAAAEAPQRAIAAGRSGDELTTTTPNCATGRWAATCAGAQRQAAVVAPGLLGVAGAWRDRHVGEPDRLTILGTLKHGKSDAAATGEARKFKPIDYPKPDGVLSFDRLTNVSFSMTNHEEPARAPALKDASIPIAVNLPKYAEPATRYCPAGVYEVVEEDGKEPRFVINFQNCVHCKTCDIKDPSQNIVWTGRAAGGRRAELRPALASQVNAGDLDRAVPIASRIIQHTPSDQLANLVLIARDARNGDWGALLGNLDAGQSVGPLFDGLVRAWALCRRGPRGRRARGLRRRGRATPGVGAFGTYHKALALALGGGFRGRGRAPVGAAGACA